MKRTDVAMIILIASISVFLSYFIVKAIFGDSANQPKNIKVADPINAVVDEPDSRIFRDNAINPTIEVFIGRGGGPS